jgi:hypothetical protein
MGRRVVGEEQEAASAAALRNPGSLPSFTGVPTGFEGTINGKDSARNEEDFRRGVGGAGGLSGPPGPRRTGRPPGRFHFKTLQDVNRTLNVVFNEFREGKISAQQLNACVVCLNAAAANLRFEKQKERSAEEGQLIERLRQEIAENERLREKLVEQGIISRSDLRAAGFNA